MISYGKKNHNSLSTLTMNAYLISDFVVYAFSLYYNYRVTLILYVQSSTSLDIDTRPCCGQISCLQHPWFLPHAFNISIVFVSHCRNVSKIWMGIVSWSSYMSPKMRFGRCLPIPGCNTQSWVGLSLQI